MAFLKLRNTIDSSVDIGDGVQSNNHVSVAFGSFCANIEIAFSMKFILCKGPVPF